MWSYDDSYGSTLCFQEFNGSGAVGDPTCWFHGFTDGRQDEHPACNSDGTVVAWARENESSSYAGKHEIWTMPTDSEDGSDATKIVETHDDATMPVWAPGDGQIAFAWNAPLGDSSTDYEIWKKNANGSGNAIPVTDNAYEDDAPTWGPAVLP